MNSFQNFVYKFKNKDENKNSFTIEQTIMSISNQEAKRKIKLEIDYKKAISTVLKDNKGNPSKNKLSINVDLKVKNERDNVLVIKSFNEEFNYDVQSNKFNMSQYVNNLIDNLNNKISDDIIFLLGTLK